MKSVLACGTFLLFLTVAAFASGLEADSEELSPYDERYWWDPAYDLTLSVKVPQDAKRQQADRPTFQAAQEYNATDFFATSRAIKHCRTQGGEISYRQYAYVSGGKVVPYGKKRAFCDLGQYTITEVETLAAPYLTLAQMAYVNPIPDFQWNKTKFSNPATHYCDQSGGASVSFMFVPESSRCESTGWTRLPAENSPGLSNTCEFADGSSIDAWALFNGQTISTAKRLNPYFRVQVQGKRCLRMPDCR